MYNYLLFKKHKNKKNMLDKKYFPIGEKYAAGIFTQVRLTLMEDDSIQQFVVQFYYE